MGQAPCVPIGLWQIHQLGSWQQPLDILQHRLQSTVLINGHHHRGSETCCEVIEGIYWGCFLDVKYFNPLISKNKTKQNQLCVVYSLLAEYCYFANLFISKNNCVKSTLHWQNIAIFLLVSLTLYVYVYFTNIWFHLEKHNFDLYWH